MNDMNARVPHKLRPTKGSEMPTNWIFLASECQSRIEPGKIDRKIHVLDQCYAEHFTFNRGEFTHSDSIRVYNPGDLWDWVATKTSKRRQVVMVGHHIGLTLTLTGFWQALESGEYDLVSDDWRLCDLKPGQSLDKRKGILCIEDPPTIIHCWCKGTSGKVVILDLQNYYPLDSAGLINSFGHLKNNYESTMDDDSALETASVCESVATGNAIRSLVRLLASGKMSGWKSTMSGLSMDSFLKSLGDKEIWIHNHADATRLEREACFGGRCEVFRHGKSPEKIYVLDVNSAYPYAMENEEYPVKLLAKVESGRASDLSSMLESGLLVAECRIASSFNRYPHRSESGVIYPEGDYWTVLTTPEIREAHACGEIVELGNVNVYRGEYLFGDWIRQMYAKRLGFELNGEAGMASALKHMMNSLSGKFAQRSARWEDCTTESAAMPWGSWQIRHAGDRLPTFYRSVHWKAQVRGVPGEHRDSFPAIYAHIAAYTRMRMRWLFDLCGMDNVYYTDTDSIHTNRVGFDRLTEAGLVGSGNMGDLKLVGSSYHAVYYGLKDYEFGGKRVIGGLSCDLHSIGERGAEQWTYPRLASVLASRPGGMVTGLRERINLSGCHVNGTVCSDGRVRPWRVEECHADYIARMASKIDKRPRTSVAGTRPADRNDDGGQTRVP